MVHVSIMEYRIYCSKLPSPYRRIALTGDMTGHSLQPARAKPRDSFPSISYPLSRGINLSAFPGCHVRRLSMVCLHVFAVLSALGFPVLAAASFPEPLIFLNLTQDEFMLKLLEHRRQDPLVSKRNPVGYESKNIDPAVQALVEVQSRLCAQRFGEGFRVIRGFCGRGRLGTKNVLDIYCNNPPNFPRHGYRHTTKSCQRGDICDTTTFINYHDLEATIAFCKSIIPVNKRPGPEVEIPPVYDGWKTLPDEVWSPGTFDTFFQLADEVSTGLKASWEYRGHHANGWGFLSDSNGKTTSFSCLGCPSGTLYVETVGFKSRAEGFTLPAYIG